MSDVVLRCVYDAKDMFQKEPSLIGHEQFQKS